MLDRPEVSAPNHQFKMLKHIDTVNLPSTDQAANKRWRRRPLVAASAAVACLNVLPHSELSQDAFPLSPAALLRPPCCTCSLFNKYSEIRPELRLNQLHLSIIQSPPSSVRQTFSP